MKETRIYLNTIEDLTKALSEGKTVYDNRGEGRKYKMLNGILMEEEEGYQYINYGFSFKKDTLYILEKETLKIEVGKFYKTREGNKVFCYNCHDGEVYDMVVMNKTQCFYFVLRDGRLFNDDTKRNGDIVDYWSEEND